MYICVNVLNVLIGWVLIYAIVFKLSSLRLSLDRNHAASLTEYLNTQICQFQLLSDPRKLLSVRTVWEVLLTLPATISSDKQMGSMYHTEFVVRIWVQFSKIVAGVTTRET